MGAVYEGVAEETGQRVAVKVLSGSFSGERDFRQRFASEIETLRRLRHPSIVRLFGFGQHEDQLFYAMELVDGISLEEELQRGRRFHWREVIHIGKEACDALRHAHDRGVIHRDIKPANLLLTAEDSVKLSDFGIAKMFGHDRLTAVGSVIGTVEYMAPEQADARPVDARADLYSLGGVLYALVAGRAPLAAGSLPEMLRKQRDEMPQPLDRFVADVPRELSELIEQLLEKKPERRILNARLLANRLEAIRLGLTRRATEASQPIEAAQGDEQGPQHEPQVDPTASPRAADPLGLLSTRNMDEEDDPAGSAGRDASAELPETLATDAFQLAPPLPPGQHDAEKPPDEYPERPEPVTEFTHVAEEELDQAAPVEESHHPLISIHTWILAASLLAIGLTTWYFLLPPSADALYERIEAQTADGKIDSISQAKEDIEDFLTMYPKDSRCERLRKFQEEIALDRLQAKFDRRVRKLGDTDGLLPIKKAYAEACNYLALDTEKGIAKLQALVDLYGNRADPTGPTGQCLELARRRLAQLEEESRRTAKDHLALLQARLAAADETKDSDPAEARRIYEAVVELYSAKPWARQAVGHAQEALRQMTDKEPIP